MHIFVVTCIVGCVYDAHALSFLVMSFLFLVHLLRSVGLHSRDCTGYCWIYLHVHILCQWCMTTHQCRVWRTVAILTTLSTSVLWPIGLVWNARPKLMSLPKCYSSDGEKYDGGALLYSMWSYTPPACFMSERQPTNNETTEYVSP